MPPPLKTRLAGVILLLVCFGLLAITPSPNAAHPKGSLSEFYFHHDHIIGTSLDLWLVAADQAVAQSAERVILDEIERLRMIFSTFDADSELSRLNRASIHEPMVVSGDMIAVLRNYEVWQKRSQGAFSGQLGELVNVWREAEKSQREPEDAILSVLVQKMSRPGWQLAGRTVTRFADLPLNLNAIAKGYIIGKAAEAARTKVTDVQGLLLNLGGDMAMWGKGEVGRRGWNVGVQDPFHPEDNAEPLAVVRLHDRAVATSGGYQRFYTIQGKRHSHIFDPRTGRSAQGNASATVLADDNVTANALATTLCVLTPEEALHLVASTPGAACLLVGNDGRQWRSPGFAAFEISATMQDKKPDEKKPEEKKEDKKAEPWPEDFHVNIALKIPQISSNRYRRPYVAVWLENSDGKAVRTVTVWGTNPRYWPSLPQWWKIGRGDNALVKAVTRATRSPGSYQIVWDGKDDKGNLVPQGTYAVHIEVHREHGKLVRQTGKITCGPAPAQITLEKNAETGATVVDYAKKKQP